MIDLRLVRLNILYGRDRYLKEIDKVQVALIQYSAGDKLQSPANCLPLCIGTNIKRFPQIGDSKRFHQIETALQQSRLVSLACLLVAKIVHPSEKQLVLVQLM